MAEYINKETAMDIFGDVPPWNGYYKPYAFETHQPLVRVVKLFREVISSLPAANVEPVRRGKWNIRVSDERTLCLECSVWPQS